MFKSLLRTLPSLTGNFTLACKVTNIKKENNDLFLGYSKEAELKPLQENLYNQYISINLLSNLYEFDVKRYYSKYIDNFYQENFIYSKNDFKKINLLNGDNYSRNKNYEFGCKRISYNSNKYQFEFFAPFYIDSINDLPDYFEIDITFNNYISKKIRINIGEENNVDYLHYYLCKYIEKLDNMMIFFNESSNLFAYHGIDVKNGGVVCIQDNTIKDILKYQTTENEFDYMINKGFENNHLIAKQIIPISFLFSIDDILNDYERLKYNFIKIQNISGKYFKDGKSIDLYDFDIDYDNHIDIYKYDNKITPHYNKWKLALSSENNIYNINFCIDSNNKINKIISNNTINYLDVDNIYNTNIDTYHLDDKYNWFTILTDTNAVYEEEFFNSSNWNACINNYVYIKDILYNLNYLFNKNENIKLDYFNIFIHPKYSIYDENSNYDVINVQNVFSLVSNTKLCNFYANLKSLYDNEESNLMEIDLSLVSETDNNILLEHDILFEKSTYSNSSTKKYILRNDLNNIYVKSLDIQEIKLLFKNNNLSFPEVDGYVQISNLHYISNFSNMSDGELEGKVYYRNKYSNSLFEINSIESNIFNGDVLDFYYKIKFCDYFTIKKMLDNNGLSDYKYILDECDKYELVINSNNIYNTFAKKESIHSPVYIDAFDRNSNIQRDLEIYERYYVKSNENIQEFYRNPIFNNYLENWVFVSPFINFTKMENLVYFKKYAYTSSIIDEFNVNDNNVYTFTINENEYQGNLYKEILGKKITKEEIKNILEKRYTYYLYTTKDKDSYDIFDFPYNIYNQTNGNDLESLEKYQYDKLLVPIFEDYRRTNEEIIFQNNLILGGNICFYDQDKNVYKKITNNTLEEYDDDSIVYVNDLVNRYKYMVEYDKKHLVELVFENIKNIYDDTQLYKKIILIHYIFNILHQEDQLEYVHFSDSIQPLVVEGNKMFIDQTELNKVIKNIIDHFNKYSLTTDLTLQNVNKFLYNYKDNENYINILKPISSRNEYNNIMNQIELSIYKNIFEHIDNENINEIINSIEENDFNSALYNFLDNLYDEDWLSFVNFLKYFKIELYEIFIKTKLNTLTNINSDNTSVTDNNIYIFENDGKKYGAIILEKYIDNTNITFNIISNSLFKKINNINLTETTFNIYFNYLLPYMKENLYYEFIKILKRISLDNIIILPKEYKIEQKYNLVENTSYNIYDYYDSLDLNDGDDKIYSLDYVKTDKKYYYTKKTINFVLPIFKKKYTLDYVYELKFKDNNLDYSKDNIFKRDLNINKYDGILCFDDYIDNSLSDNKYHIIEEYEYKHFNSNSSYLLENQIIIEINEYLTYEKLLEYETFEKTFEYFKNYVKKFIKINKDNDNQILFLFNKYKVSYHSNPISLDFLSNEKLYKIKYIFNLI